MRMRGICMLLALWMVCACSAALAHGHSLIVEPQELSDALASGEGIFVDLRPEKYYNRMHIPGFIHLPYDETDVLTLAQAEEPVYLICAAGRTSARAYNLLLEAGAQEVHAAVFGVEEYAEAMGLENMEGADICVPCILLQKAQAAEEAQADEDGEIPAGKEAEIEELEEEQA